MGELENEKERVERAICVKQITLSNHLIAGATGRHKKMNLQAYNTDIIYNAN